ncbi:MAG: hypothetical protein HQK88_03655 [Nitrospirae bacterium]|nr:hypothetical protein [Nitrospirota bacterium]MBF0534188.1 hypothetical protein [Nitrospirota bacterium]MBF0615898.1 hypothetical protein [Nitrospirota bacterium]
MSCPFYKDRICSKVVTYEYYPSFFQVKEYCLSEKDDFTKCPFFKFGKTLTGVLKTSEIVMEDRL